MQQRDKTFLIVILVLVIVAGWVAWPGNPGIHIKLGATEIGRDIKVHLGLDLQGGMRVLLQAALPPGEEVTSDAMDAARNIIENRVDALGVTEPVVQSVGQDRISVELPGIEDPEQAIATLKDTGLLEFVDAGFEPLQAGMVVRTSFSELGVLGEVPDVTPEPTVGTPGTEGITETVPGRIYPTVLTGRHLRRADIGFDPQRGTPEVLLEFTDEGTRIFAEYTAANIGTFLAIAMDQRVISSPRIESAIPDGNARITSPVTSPFSLDEVRSVVVQLKYGALPVPLEVIEQRSVGPTLGQASVERSTRAGIIGCIIVLLFMLIYYRLPGLVADVALVIYALLTFALFKLIPVTLTLPGIAGFLLSVGTAVDANILIFERIKEELRRGRPLNQAVNVGFDRAWTAIWDSNLAGFITCIVLWVFGNTYGASIVKGFAVTLFIGVAMSLFSAVTVTRTLLRAVFFFLGDAISDKKWLLGA